jgi:hypothetical protein
MKKYKFTMSLSAIVQSLLEKIARGEQIPEFQQGILFAYSLQAQYVPVETPKSAGIVSKNNETIQECSQTEEHATHPLLKAASETKPTVVGNSMVRPYLSHLKDGEIIEIRQKANKPALEKLTVQFRNGKLEGFYRASNNTLYRNVTAACKVLWTSGGTQSASYCYVERDGTWVTLESLSA